MKLNNNSDKQLLYIKSIEEENKQLKLNEKRIVLDLKKRGDFARDIINEKDKEIKILTNQLKEFQNLHDSLINSSKTINNQGEVSIVSDLINQSNTNVKEINNKIKDIENLNSCPESNKSSSNTNHDIQLLRFQYIEKEKELHDTINSLQMEVCLC